MSGKRKRPGDAGTSHRAGNNQSNTKDTASTIPPQGIVAPSPGLKWGIAGPDAATFWQVDKDGTARPLTVAETAALLLRRPHLRRLVELDRERPLTRTGNSVFVGVWGGVE